MEPRKASRRISGWKAIANYINVTPSTAQRYERERQLPVSRPPGTKRAIVSADTSDLDQWLADAKSAESNQTASDVTGARTASLTSIAPDQDGNPQARWRERLSQWAGGHLLYLIVTSAGYAALYVIGLLLETAAAPSPHHAVLTVPVFLWVFLTTVATAFLASLWMRHGMDHVGPVCATILLLAAFLLWSGLRSYLPAVPIVKAKFQTQTPQAAYLKNTAYYVVLILGLWLPTLLAVLSMPSSGATTTALRANALEASVSQRRVKASPGRLFPTRFAWLAGVWAGILIVSAFGQIRLLENLEPADYLNRYTTLLYFRFFVYTGLGASILWWYHRNLVRLHINSR